jgi:hypothetical protein
MNRLHTIFATQLRRDFVSVLLPLVTLVTLNATATAQSATATLSGSVTDQAGAVIAQATVKAVNTATNLERKTTTNSEGFSPCCCCRPAPTRSFVNETASRRLPNAT